MWCWEEEEEKIEEIKGGRDSAIEREGGVESPETTPSRVEGRGLGARGRLVQV